MIKDDIIQPIRSVFSSLMVMVTKKDGLRHVYPNYREPKKMTIKYEFPIHVIDELLN